MQSLVISEEITEDKVALSNQWRTNCRVVNVDIYT